MYLHVSSNEIRLSIDEQQIVCYRMIEDIEEENYREDPGLKSQTRPLRS